MTKPDMKYRADIDGLRAIAVLSVVLYHAGFTFLSGGFTGVDIFFVISGFLITKILLKDLEQDKFSLLMFYERRIRRIFPALFVVCFVTAIFAYVLLMPEDAEKFGKSLIAAILFISNMWFWKDTGYFDGAALSKPLLHTWSLAVEEQFYIFFPLVIWALFKFQRNYIIHYFIIGFILSLALSIWGVYNYPKATFYFLPTRAWELLIGAILATGYLKAPSNRHSVEIISALGLMLIMIGLFTLSEESLFPGHNALYPCLGAALMIYAGGSQHSSFVLKAVSIKPMVFIGLISYSLYLVHWPIMAFWHYYSLGASSTLITCSLVTASILLSIISWKYIEQPFRHNKTFFTRKFLYVMATAGMGLLCAIGMFFIQTGGNTARFTAADKQMLEYRKVDNKTHYNTGSCFITSGHNFSQFDQEKCLSLSKPQENYLLIGDSHAAHYLPGLKHHFPNITIMQANVSGCAPLKDYKTNRNQDCQKMKAFLFEDFIPNHNIDGVILGAKWKDAHIDFLEPTLTHLSSHVNQVYVFGPLPTYGANVPEILVRFPPDKLQGKKYKDMLNIAPDDIDSALEAIALKNEVKYFSPYKELCPNTKQDCILILEDNIPMQYDADHLTPDGSKWIIQQWKAQK